MKLFASLGIHVSIVATFLLSPVASSMPVTVSFAGTFGVPQANGSISFCGPGFLILTPTVCGRDFSGYYTFDDASSSGAYSGFPYGLVFDIEGLGHFIAPNLQILIRDNILPPIISYDPEFDRLLGSRIIPLDLYSVFSSSDDLVFRLDFHFVSLDANRLAGSDDLARLPDVSQDYFGLGDGNRLRLFGFDERETWFDGRSFRSLFFADHFIPVPEPSSFALVLSLLGCLLVARFRFSDVRPRESRAAALR